jgi:hypothetical protein
MNDKTKKEIQKMQNDRNVFWLEMELSKALSPEISCCRKCGKPINKEGSSVVDLKNGYVHSECYEE